MVRDLDPQGEDLGFRTFYIAKTVEHDVGALARERFGDAQSDAAGGTGDKGSFVGKHG
ncbi:hypothetical protein D9M68_887450 [compost metagenome]